MFSPGDVVMFELFPGTGTKATGRVYAVTEKGWVVILFNGNFYGRPESEVRGYVNG